MHPGALDHVMHVLGDAVGVMSRHHRRELITPLGVGGKHGAVAIALDIVVTEMVGLPDFNRGIGTGLTARVENRTADH